MATPLAAREAEDGDLGRRCAICQTAFQAGERLGACPQCASPFHEACWEENGGCAVYGCALTPAATAAPPVPSSVWGQEERDCPGCGGRIKMAARRCLHCGRDVAAPAPGAAPAGAGRGAPGVRAALAFLVAGLLPVTAPLALVAGAAWLLARRRELARWPAGVRVLVVTGLVGAAAITFVTLLGLAVHFGRLPRDEG